MLIQLVEMERVRVFSLEVTIERERVLEDASIYRNFCHAVGSKNARPN